MKVAILGFEAEGRASFEYFKALGHDITICDGNPHKQVPAGIASQLGDSSLDNLDRFDLLLRTPSLKPEKILAKNVNVADKITSGSNEFFKACPSKNIIGVTGTKGKGTTSTLIARLLEATGKKVFLGGNIGVPALSFINQVKPEDYVVLELSSYQLSDIKYSPHIAVCLMVVPEHQDWHKDMANYALAKQQLFRWQKSDDIAIYFHENEHSKRIVEISAGQKVAYFSAPGAVVDESGNIVIDGNILCHKYDLQLLGRHNRQNVCAAVTAVWQVAQDVEAIRSVLKTFRGLPHRLEFIREVAGVSYYNDSFASTPDAAMAAVDSFLEMKVPIIGGFDRKLPIGHLAQHLKKHEATLRKVLIIGASAERVAEECRQVGFENFVVSKAQTMPEIVAKATQLAEPGDAVILTPGFASFDMFKNFEERGTQFRKVVKSL